MSTATLSVASADSTSAEPTVNFSQPRFAYRQLEIWCTSEEANQLSEAQAEQHVAEHGREVLRLLLEAHLRQRGSGDVGAAVRVFTPSVSAAKPEDPDSSDSATKSKDAPRPACRQAGSTAGCQEEGVVHSQKRCHDRTLRTVLGKVLVERTAYAAVGQTSIHPLDEQLELPERSFSYPLQERLVRHAVLGPFTEALESVEQATGVKVSKRSAEQVVEEAAVDFLAFYKQQTTVPVCDRQGRSPGLPLQTERSLLMMCRSDPERGGPIVVTGVDCKGVPMIKPEETLRKVRRGKGDKKQKKRMATVATVRTQQLRVRTPEEVVESLFRTTPKPKPAQKRRADPVAKEHKRVWADLLQSKDEVIAEVVEEVRRVDPSGSKTHVALCDGERALQKRLLPALQKVAAGAVLILDLLHVLQRLWQAAHVFYPEGSEEATAWAKKQTLRVLEGDVSQVIKGIRQSATKRGVTGKKLETLETIAKYLHRNRPYMKYNVYLRNGWPIASGCVEGACKNLIKDRLERSGMRWSLDGAQAMIRLRSLYLSGDWEDYWDFHQRQEHQRLYPQGQWEVVEK
jgi:hypothetical protein